MANARAVYEITTKDKSTAVINKVRGGLTGLTKSVFSTRTAFVTLAGAAGIGAFIAASNQSIDVLAKQAAALGVSTQALAGMQFAAGQASGVTEGKFNKSLQTMVIRIGDAAQGIGLAKNALETLGLEANDLNLLDPAEQMRVIGDEFQKVESQADRVKIAFELFGGAGVKLATTLALGSEGLDAFQEKARLLGIAITDIDAKKVEAANDSLDSAGQLFKGFGQTLSVEVAPFITAIADGFTDSAIEAGGFGQIAKNAVNGVVTAIGFLMDTVQNMRIAFAGVQVVIATLADTAIQSFSTIAKGWVEIANLIPGIEVDFNKTFLGQLGTASTEQIEILKTQLNDLANQPAPSLAFKQRVTEARTELQLAAEDAAALNAIVAGLEGGEGETRELSDEDTSSFEKLQESFATEQEILAEQRATDLELLAAAEQAKIDSIIPFKQLKEKIEQRHLLNMSKLQQRQAQDEKKTLQDILKSNLTAEQKKTQLAQLSQRTRNAFALSEGRNALASLASVNKKAFEANKAFGIADALVSTAQGAAGALKLPFPINIAAVASTVAAGIAQVNTIKGTSFGGGGSLSKPSPPSISGGGGLDSLASLPGGSDIAGLLDQESQGITTGTTPGRPAPIQISVNIEDDAIFSGEQVRGLIDSINDEVENGAELRTA